MAQPIVLWKGKEGHAGLGDRLGAVFGGAVLAASINCHLVFRWLPSEQFPGHLDDLCSLPGVSSFARYERNQHEYGEPKLLIDEPSNLAINRIFEMFQPLHGISDRGAFRRKVREVAAAIKPVDEVGKVVEDFSRKNLRNCSLAVHLRRTDVLDCSYYRISEPMLTEYDRLLLEEAVLQMKRRESPKVLLVGDDRAYVQDFSQKLCERGADVVKIEHQWIDNQLRQTSPQAAMIDMLLLSKVDTILTSTPSQFAFCARYIGGAEVKVIEPTSAFKTLLKKFWR